MCWTLKFFDVSIPDADTYTALDGLAVFFSFVPYVWGLSVLCLMLIFRRLSFILWSMFLVSLVVLNEAIFKQIIKEARPPESCLSTYGMPSGHALIALASLTWVVIEMRFRLQWQLHNKLAALIAAVFCFIAVPWSRQQLHDHYWYQTLAGALIGVTLGGLWSLLMLRTAAVRTPSWFNTRFFVAIKAYNDYTVNNKGPVLLSYVQEMPSQKLVE
eukprot:GILK01000587.1.p1 GENE.GILK01000587.1~~GILK01000587.1.p1  ORF type:complete len:215 (+),score=25.69 GILK01000587.1:42-686(+)